MELTARPLVPELWPAFEDLFEDSPVCRCWCMYWRIGAVLAEELWNRGLMTEAVTAVVEWGFRRFERLERVTTGAVSANVGSRRVLDKCGFELEGLVGERWAKFEEPVELASYTLTRGRWGAYAEAAQASGAA